MLVSYMPASYRSVSHFLHWVLLAVGGESDNTTVRERKHCYGEPLAERACETRRF